MKVGQVCNLPFVYNAFMIRRLNIAEVIVNGLVFDPKQSPFIRELDVDELLASVPRLFKILDERKVDYLLVGGIAMLVYVEGRNTQDIILIVSSADLNRVPELVVEDRNPQFARAKYGQLQVDLLLGDDPFFAAVRKRHAVEREFLDGTVQCATVEGLMLLKLFALPSLYRQGQFDRVELYERDLTMLIRSYRPDLPELFKELGPHLSQSDLGEVRSIVAEIEERIAKNDQRFRE